MTVIFPLLLLIIGLMCVPAYIASSRRGEESKWLLFASLPSIAAWVSLTGLGYGAQSLSNIIEVFWVVAASIVLCYLKVVLLDGKIEKPAKTTYYMMGVLTLGAILLRAFMPVLPK